MALAARSLLVLVGLGLSVLGTGDGLVKGVVLVDSGVLAVVGAFVVPAVAGLELGALVVAELGFAVWGLDVGVFAAEGVVAGRAEAGLMVVRVVADVGLDTPFVCGFAVVPGLLAFALGADPTVVFGAVVLGLAGGTDRLDADACPPAGPAFVVGAFGVAAEGLGLDFASVFLVDVGALGLDGLDALPIDLDAVAAFGVGFEVFFKGADSVFSSMGSPAFFVSSTGGAAGKDMMLGSSDVSAVSFLTSSAFSIFVDVFAFNS